MHTGRGNVLTDRTAVRIVGRVRRWHWLARIAQDRLVVSGASVVVRSDALRAIVVGDLGEVRIPSQWRHAGKRAQAVVRVENLGLRVAIVTRNRRLVGRRCRHRDRVDWRTGGRGRGRRLS